MRVGHTSSTNKTVMRVGHTSSTNTTVMRVGHTSTTNTTVMRVGHTSSTNTTVMRVGHTNSSNTTVNALIKHYLYLFRPPLGHHQEIFHYQQATKSPLIKISVTMLLIYVNR